MQYKDGHAAPSEPRAALFDMDGLLLDTERVGLLAFQEVVAPLGMAASAAKTMFLTLIGTSNAHTRSQLGKTFPDHVETIFEDWRDTVDRLMLKEVPLRPGAREVVMGLANRGLPMAVVTSTTTDRARAHLAEAGLLDAFVDVIGGDRVTANKPDPAPYLAGSKIVGQPPNHCVAFEDSDAGTQAAVAAGCLVWQIPDLRPPGVALPDLGQSVALSLMEAAKSAGVLEEFR